MSSGTRRTIATNLPVGLTINSFMTAYAIPTRVAVDTDGTIYLSADVNNAVYRFRVCS